jgi:hypothetical protein
MIKFKEFVVVLCRHFLFPAKQKERTQISMVETERRGLAVCQNISGFFFVSSDFSTHDLKL